MNLQQCNLGFLLCEDWRNVELWGSRWFVFNPLAMFSFIMGLFFESIDCLIYEIAISYCGDFCEKFVILWVVWLAFSFSDKITYVHYNHCASLLSALMIMMSSHFDRSFSATFLFLLKLGLIFFRVTVLLCSISFLTAFTYVFIVWWLFGGVYFFVFILFEESALVIIFPIWHVF